MGDMVHSGPQEAVIPTASGCGCIAEMNGLLAEHNTTLVTTMFRQPNACVIATERVQSLRNGKKAALVIASFCPFCGTKCSEDTPKGADHV